jgi:aryl-alcohol dehydrogenase-like predicted oxidoreductase
VIPGARTSAQARANAEAASLPALPEATHEAVSQLYREQIAPQVHQRW